MKRLAHLALGVWMGLWVTALSPNEPTLATHERPKSRCRCVFRSRSARGCECSQRRFQLQRRSGGHGRWLGGLRCAGFAALAAKFIKKLESASGERVKWVVISHYHADHFYGLQNSLAPGVEVIAHPKAIEVFNSDNTPRRLEQRKQDLFPWINEQTRLIAPTRQAKVSGAQTERLQLGRYHFTLLDGRSGHAEDDLMMRVDELGVLFTGDLFFTGRLPFVGNSDPKDWLRAIENMMQQMPKVAIPGHGPVSHSPDKDIAMTQKYLNFLSESMAKAVAEMQTFEEAYAATDWSAFRDLPAFEAANKLNAYGAFVNAEKDALKSKP